MISYLLSERGNAFIMAESSVLSKDTKNDENGNNLRLILDRGIFLTKFYSVGNNSLFMILFV